MSSFEQAWEIDDDIFDFERYENGAAATIAPREGMSWPAGTTQDSIVVSSKLHAKSQAKTRSRITCSVSGCQSSFGRSAELRRHEKSKHRNDFVPCPASGYVRVCDGLFPRVRRDKIKEHVQKMHKSSEERCMWPIWFGQLGFDCVE